MVLLLVVVNESYLKTYIPSTIFPVGPTTVTNGTNEPSFILDVKAVHWHYVIRVYVTSDLC
jgi:hypothetical protein